MSNGTVVYVHKMPNCDICRTENHKNRRAKYDAVLMDSGQWAFLCETHWTTRTRKVLGIGTGQRLEVR